MIKFPSSCNYQYKEVTLKEITEDDYNILRKAIDESKPMMTKLIYQLYLLI